MSGLSANGVARFRQGVRAHVGADDPSGIVALLARGADVHVEATVPADTLFHISSMTKPITAMALLKLADRGRLSLDAPVEIWLPELACRRVLRNGVTSAIDDTVPAERSITVRDLLTLQCGYGAIMAAPRAHPIQRAMEDAGVSPGFDPIRLSHDEYLAKLAPLPLVHSPGAGWLYHMGLELAGILIARVAKRSLSEVLHDEIFAPLGMRDTAYVVPPASRGRLAPCVRREGGALVVDETTRERSDAPPRFESGGGQGGALVSTAADYCAFARALVGGSDRILRPETLQSMTTDAIDPKVKAAFPFFPGFWAKNGWGMGIGIMTGEAAADLSRRRVGWGGAFGTTFFVDRASGLIAILMTQRILGGPAPDPIFDDFERLALASIDAE